MKNSSRLSPRLKDLISRTVRLLGISIQDMYGQKIYLEVEKIRKSMKSIRGASPKAVELSLHQLHKRLNQRPTGELEKVAKSYALMLELINRCETVERLSKLDRMLEVPAITPESIIYVFTSHPTESRSLSFLKIMDRIQEVMLLEIHSKKEDDHSLLFLFKLALNTHIANSRKVAVSDEMFQIFHTVLDKKILQQQIELYRSGVSMQFRTWVGGDKDGHPGVNQKTLQQSLTMSRQYLLVFLKEQIEHLEEEISYSHFHEKTKVFFRDLRLLVRQLKFVKENDGAKIEKLRSLVTMLVRLSKKNNLVSPHLMNVYDLMWIYPALVLPLEMREDSQLVLEAREKPRAPIVLMLKKLKAISRGFDPKWYVRGLVLSMCMKAEHLVGGARLVKDVFGFYSIPVVPLFENEVALVSGIDILTKALTDFPFVREHDKRWNKKFEVMVGYSDSSKESGVLPARILVEDAIKKIDKFLVQKKCRPVFFHGSGGSTTRGGGSVEEQVSWWPKNALSISKVTIQGEMVQRHFSEPQLIQSQVGKILHAFSQFKERDYIYTQGTGEFSNIIKLSYRSLVQGESFLKMVGEATPYNYLRFLKIGSRPVKRNKSGTFQLRAIPWVMCWTQNRLLLPVWWGVGSGWGKLNSKEKNDFKKDYASSPLIQSYVKNLGFSLAKIEFGVFLFLLEDSRLTKEEKKYWKLEISLELNKTIKFFTDITKTKNYTWFRPWLGESIMLRSSMIHPLNVIQKIAQDRKESQLLRETVTGIACGMLTTG